MEETLTLQSHKIASPPWNSMCSGTRIKPGRFHREQHSTAIIKEPLVLPYGTSLYILYFVFNYVYVAVNTCWGICIKRSLKCTLSESLASVLLSPDGKKKQTNYSQLFERLQTISTQLSQICATHLGHFFNISEFLLPLNPPFISLSL